MDETRLDPRQVQPSKEEFLSLYEQLEFGRFNSIKSSAAPVLYQEFQATEGQTLFVLPYGAYTMGDKSLMVFLNGQLVREGKDYVEVDTKTIRFSVALTGRDMVVLRVNGGTSGAALHEIHTSVDGQTVFTLDGSYTVGNHSLHVFLGGLYRNIEADYVETDSKTVTFLYPLRENQNVTFIVHGIPQEEPVHQNTSLHITRDADGRITKREELGDRHVIEEFFYDTNGLPERMVITKADYIVTKFYTWVDGVCTDINTTVTGGV